MDNDTLKELLNSVKNGDMAVDKAIGLFKGMPYNDLGFAKIDNHRHVRCGFPEAIFCQGKTVEQIVEIIDKTIKDSDSVLATRASEEVFKAVEKKFPQARFNKLGRTITIRSEKKGREGKGLISIVTAGTSDIPVAEEARETAEIVGNKVNTIYDVGVAGIHRLFDNMDDLADSNVVIVVAGMEGALASVIGGLVNCPVIGVPTSVGYGASFGGIAPLLSMLNSCAPGVSVVNIDNGFGAACVASLINSK